MLETLGRANQVVQKQLVPRPHQVKFFFFVQLYIYIYQVRRLLRDNLKKHISCLHMITYDYSNRWITLSSRVNQSPKISWSSDLCKCIIMLVKIYTACVDHSFDFFGFLFLNILTIMDDTSTHVGWHEILGRSPEDGTIQRLESLYVTIWRHELLFLTFSHKKSLHTHIHTHTMFSKALGTTEALGL